MLKGIKILVVDDEEIIRNLLTDVLNDEGCEVTAVPDGAEAVARVKETAFDVVFSDVHMPVMNGVEIVKAIKKIKPETVIIMMDSYPDHLLAQAQEAGALTYIHKPFNIKTLLAIMEKIKGGRR